MSENNHFFAYCTPEQRWQAREMFQKYFDIDHSNLNTYLDAAVSEDGKLPVKYYCCFSHDIYKNSLRRAKEIFPNSIINDDNTEIQIINSKGETIGCVCQCSRDEFLEKHQVRFLKEQYPL